MATGIPTLFRSDDGGMTFTNTALSFHPVGLGRRDSTIFVATNDYVDGFALTSSADLGQTWTPRLRFRDVTDIKACVFTMCQGACAYLAGTTLFPAAVCDPATGSPTDGSTDGEATPSSKGGCACDMAGEGASGIGLAFGTSLVAGGLARRARRRRRAA
jgi:MYXO-CTERM domain-containing protein